MATKTGTKPGVVTKVGSRAPVVITDDPQTKSKTPPSK